MATITGDTEQLESFITNECSQRIRNQHDSRRPAANTAAGLDEPVSQGNNRLFRVIQSHLSGNGNAGEGDGKSMSQRKHSRQRTSQDAMETLPAYKKVAEVESYKDCGCVDNTNRARSFVKRIVTKPEYIVNVLGVHIRNPLHVKGNQSETRRPPQKLSKKINQARKEAKRARKEAVSAKKKAVKAKTKAVKFKTKAMKTKKTIQEARDVVGDAAREANLARQEHVGAMRWATYVARDAQKIYEETSNALDEAREFSGKADYCDHTLA